MIDAPDSLIRCIPPLPEPEGEFALDDTWQVTFRMPIKVNVFRRWMIRVLFGIRWRRITRP